MHSIFKNLRGLHPGNIFNHASGFLFLIIIWYCVSTLHSSPALPKPLSIFKTVFLLIGDTAYITHIAASLKIVMLGIGLAVFVGFSIGLLIFRYDFVRKAACPVMESVRGISALTLFPLLIVLFGLGTFSRVTVIFWTAWPAVIISTIQSLDVDKTVIDAARNCGAGEWQTIFRIRLPMALPGIITGIRIGFGGGWISLVAAEMLGASKGIGYYLMWSSQSFHFDKVYASIVIIAAIGGFMNMILLSGQKYYTKLVGV